MTFLGKEVRAGEFLEDDESDGTIRYPSEVANIPHVFPLVVAVSQSFAEANMGSFPQNDITGGSE